MKNKLTEAEIRAEVMAIEPDPHEGTRVPRSGVDVLTEKFHRHGGPSDRGGADAWYERPCRPHYYEGATGQSKRIEEGDMTEAEVRAYVAAWDQAMFEGNHKRGAK